MTKKDYLLISDVINHQINELHYSNKLAIDDVDTYSFSITNSAIYELQILADKLADKLKKDNRLFDKDKFLNACGVLNNTNDPESSNYIA